VAKARLSLAKGEFWESERPAASPDTRILTDLCSDLAVTTADLIAA
jgi:hypothetical protein